MMTNIFGRSYYFFLINEKTDFEDPKGIDITWKSIGIHVSDHKMGKSS